MTVYRVLLAFLRGVIDSLSFYRVFLLSLLRESSSLGGKDKEFYSYPSILGKCRGENLAKKRSQVRRDLTKRRDVGDEALEPRILERTLKCCLLNGCVFWLSIVAFENLLLPSVKFITERLVGAWLWTTVFRLLSATFNTLWVLPFYVLSKFVNALWFADIADSAFRSCGMATPPRMMNTFSIAIADVVFSLLVESIFLLQAKFCSLLFPIFWVGRCVNFFHLCLLHALYCFEYKWFNQGLELHKRLAFVETHWPYFAGFGLPLTALTIWPSSHVVSGCVFSVVFPLFIVAGNQAEVVSTEHVSPVRIFHPTIALSNALLSCTLKKRT